MIYQSFLRQSFWKVLSIIKALQVRLMLVRKQMVGQQLGCIIKEETNIITNIGKIILIMVEIRLKCQ
nr:MAG TPA: hypothetical protein [Caudoviricetes sp.]